MRSRRISQSSWARPGSSTARFRRWRRPDRLTIEPRFSAKAAEGRTMWAASAVGFARTLVCRRKASCFRSSTVKPASVTRSSPRTTSALIEPLRTLSRMKLSCEKGVSVLRISFAPVVLGLRSAATSSVSASAERGTREIRWVPISAARVRVRKSSSFVMRPEAMIATCSGGTERRRWAASAMASFHGVGTKFSGETLALQTSGSVRRASLSM